MRQLFSSPRIENVEAVARMLEDAGIEVRISNGRSYRGAIRGNFSYREGAGSGPRPSVWVIRSDQQPEARRMLREAGLLQESPIRGESFMASASPAPAPSDPAMSRRGGNRFRYGLLLAVAVMVALVMLAWRAGRDDGDAGADLATAPATAPSGGITSTQPAPEAPEAPAMPDVATLPEDAFVIATPQALATTLLRQALAAAGTTRGCLAIDGADPEPAVLQALAGEGLDVVAASSCGDGRLAVAVSDYATDGSGSGTVQLAVGDGGAQTLAVRREGRDWHRDATR